MTASRWAEVVPEHVFEVPEEAETALTWDAALVEAERGDAAALEEAARAEDFEAEEALAEAA